MSSSTRTPPGDHSAGQTIPSADWNDFPRGWVAEMSRVTNSSGGDTTGVIWGTVDFTAQAGRAYVVHLSATIRSDTAGGGGIVLKLDGTQIQRMNTDVLTAGVDSFISFVSPLISDPGAGTHTLDAVVRAAGADGNTVQVRANGAADGSAGFICLDVGPA